MTRELDKKLARQVQRETGVKYQTALNKVRALLEADDESQPWDLFKEQVVIEAVRFFNSRAR